MFWIVEQHVNFFRSACTRPRAFEILSFNLHQQGFSFTRQGLLWLVEEEFRHQHSAAFRYRMLFNSPPTEQAIIQNYMESCYREPYRSLDRVLLSDLLQECGFSRSAPLFLLGPIKEHLERNFSNRGAICSYPYSMYVLDGLDGRSFERFIKNLFLRQGWWVEEGNRADQGADHLVDLNGVRTSVQVKRYSRPVGNDAIQQSVASIRFHGAQRGMVMTNSHFTNAAKDLAIANQIELIDREHLDYLIKLTFPLAPLPYQGWGWVGNP
jgi:HJR/Mrr/RecB family endonuclease